MELLDLFGVKLGTEKHEKDLRVRLIDGGNLNLTENLGVFIETFKAADAQFKALEEKITALEEANAGLKAKMAGVMVFRKVWEPGLIFQPGETVVDKSAVWVCTGETASRPPGQHWCLALKSEKGR